MQTDLLRFLISLITFSVLLGTTALSQQLEYVHPKPTGTYFKDVTFVPDTDRVFAIADNSCLVYQSDDGGTSWSERCILPSPKAEDGFDQVFFVNAQIGFLVNNSGHIYRTEDAGATWTVAYDSIGCNMFDFEMNVNGIGVAAVNAGKIFYSDDFGISWKSKRLSNTQVYTSVGLTDNNEIILSGRNAGGWYSVDTARTGIEVTFGGMNEIEFWDTLRGIAMSEGSIIYTEDGGGSWFFAQTIEPFIQAMQLDEDGIALVSDGRNMYRSEDYGKSFQEVLEYTAILDTGDFNLFVDIQGITMQGEVAIAVGDHGTLLRSADAGLTWEVRSTHLTTNDLSDLYVSGDQMIAVGETEILFSKDGGSSLSRQRGPDFRLIFVDQFSDGTMITISDDGEVYTSTDFGTNWIEQTEIEASVRERLQDAQILPDESIVVVGNDGLMAQSSDQGTTWTLREGPFSEAEADLRTIDFLTARSGVVGSTRDRLYRTDDGGQSWSDISINQDGQTRSLIDVEMIDSLTILAYRTHGAYLSNDGGLTYVEENTDFHEAVEFDDGGSGIWNGFTNVYVTEDYGKHWFLLTREAESVFNRARIFDQDIWLVGQSGLIWRAKDAFLRVSTSTPEITTARAFDAYPNPLSHQELHIELQGENFGTIGLQMHTAQGRLVMQSEHRATGGRIRLDALDLPEGLYYVSLVNKNGMHLGTQSLVISN